MASMNRAMRRSIAKSRPVCQVCHNEVGSHDLELVVGNPLHRTCVERLKQAAEYAEQKKKQDETLRAQESAKAFGLWLPGSDDQDRQP
jgi:hypothetical protein